MLKIREKTIIKKKQQNKNKDTQCWKAFIRGKNIVKMQQSKNKTLEVSIPNVHGKNHLQAFKVF
jgi:hypothetical protein